MPAATGPAQPERPCPGHRGRLRPDPGGGALTSPRLLARVLAAEGARGVRDRLLDRGLYGLETLRLGRLRNLGESVPGELRSKVLHLHATPPWPWRGGVETQLVRRRKGSEEHPFALLFAAGDRFALEVRRGSSGARWDLGAATGRPGETEPWPALEEAVERARDLLGAELLHVENLAGLAAGSLVRLAGSDTALVLSLHDYSAFCRRPHLLERQSLAFCHFCTDLDRCARCLDRPRAEAQQEQEERRASVARLLARADAVVYASAYLRRELGAVFPDLPARRQHVIPPTTGARGDGPPPDALGYPRHPGEPRKPRKHDAALHLAWVGSVQPHKGSRILIAILDSLTAAERAELRVTVYGGGDPEELAALRRRGVGIRGYYRCGGLPALLRRDGADLALVLSVMPEPYCLAADECLEAGVPVLAFDHGAVGERFGEEPGVLLVDPRQGATGMLRELRRLLAGEDPWPVPSAPPAIPGPGVWEELYRTVLDSRRGAARSIDEGP